MTNFSFHKFFIWLSKDGVSEIKTEYSEHYARDRTNKQLETHIEKVWSEKSLKNPTLFNKSKFRLHEIIQDHQHDLILRVGKTSYKAHCATDYNLNLPSINRHQKANKIATGGVLLTSDNKIILQKRASWVNSCPGQIDTVGGHPEPDNVLDLQNDQAVADEIFTAQKQEIYEELNLEEADIIEHTLHK